MFCTQCGNKIADSANFCTQCGSRAGSPPPPLVQQPPPVVQQPPPVVQPSQPVVQQPPPSSPSIGAIGQVTATPVSAAGSAKCKWCGATFDGVQTTCPKCGAALDVATVKSRSGWAKLPGRKDMAKLQFGNSVCQIEGTYVPVADLKLAPEDSVYFSHHVLLWKDSQVNMTAMSMKGGWKRMLGGLPLIMAQAQGPGHIAFSQDSPGELIALPLQHGQSIDVREHLFLAATGNVVYDWFQTNIWFSTRSGNETETHYPVGRVMDRFSASGMPGLLLLHAAGNVFVRDLAPGQVILIKPTALVFKDPSVQMILQYDNNSVASWFSSSFGYMWLRLVGPGRVAIQSVFERIEGEQQNVSSFSNNPIGGLIMGEMLGDALSSFFDSSD